MAVAGWYAGPYGAQGQLRYWDGAQWTANVMPRPSSAPMQGAAGVSGPTGAQPQAAQAAQAAQMQARAVHESIPLGASTAAAPTAGAYGYQGQPMDQQYAAQAAQAQGQAQANPYGAGQAQGGYAQMANTYEAAAQGYAQAANAYDAAAQGYAQVAQYEAAQGYGQYDPNAQAYGQMGASPYYQSYDPYGQMVQTDQTQAPEGSNRTLRLLAFVFFIISIVGVVALVVVVALSFFNVIPYSYGSPLTVIDDLGPIAFVVALPLAWLIPMCIHTLGILKGKKRNTVLFGVLSLLLCGLLPGLFLLIAKKDPKPAEMDMQQGAQYPMQQPMA